MRCANRLQDHESVRYLEFNREHLAQFIEAIGGSIYLDSNRSAELSRLYAGAETTLWPSGSTESALVRGGEAGQVEEQLNATLKKLSEEGWRFVETIYAQHSLPVLLFKKQAKANGKWATPMLRPDHFPIAPYLFRISFVFSNGSASTVCPRPVVVVARSREL